MAQRKNATSYSLYPYFDMYRTEETIEQSHQEIEQAIDSVTLSKLDRKIKKIWDRVLGSPGSLSAIRMLSGELPVE